MPQRRARTIGDWGGSLAFWKIGGATSPEKGRGGAAAVVARNGEEESEASAYGGKS